MSEWAVVFLGVIALAALVQCVFVVVAALSLRNSGERINELCMRFDAEIKPTLGDLRQAASNLRTISDSAREQAARVETLLATTLKSVETTVDNVRTMVTRPVETLTELSAFWGGLRQGIDSYRKAGPRRRSSSPAARRSEDTDEHLFIG